MVLMMIFFAHQEEIDLCWRAFNLGYRAKYCPNSVVYHVGGATLNEANPKKHISILEIHF